MRVSIFIFLYFIFYISYSQTKRIDSLKNSFRISKIDTSKINTLILISDELKKINIDSSMFYAKKALVSSENSNYKIGEAYSNLLIGIALSNSGHYLKALDKLLISEVICLKEESIAKQNHIAFKKILNRVYTNIGNTYQDLGNYKLAISYQEKSFNVAHSIDDKMGIIRSYINMANIYSIQGNYTGSIKKYYNALKIYEAMNDIAGVGSCYNNIGLIYLDQSMYLNAESCLKRALNCAIKTGLAKDIGNYYANISNCYLEQNKLDTALTYSLKAYKEGVLSGDKRVIIHSLHLTGIVYSKFGKNRDALKYQFEAYDMAKKYDLKMQFAEASKAISEIYKSNNDIDNSILYSEKALNIASEINVLQIKQDASEILFKNYFQIKKFKKAFEIQHVFFETKDSINNEYLKEELYTQKFNNEYSKQLIADSIEYENKKALNIFEQTTKIKSEKNKHAIILIGLCFVVLASLMIYNRSESVNKKNKIIEIQNTELEKTYAKLSEKTKEVTDSILYSKEIQNTFLKSPSSSSKYINNSFLIYKPKEVVSGDFYWYTEINDVLCVIVGDCSINGVPGAIISLLTMQSFENIFKKGITSEILSYLNKKIMQELLTYNLEEQKMGFKLDYSIICIDKTLNKLFITGFNSNVLIKMTNNLIYDLGFSLTDINRNLDIKTYDILDVNSVFLFTNGLINQDGDDIIENKFGIDRLIQLIANFKTNDKTIAESKIEIELNNWQGTLEQNDDITLFAMQFNQSLKN